LLESHIRISSNEDYISMVQTKIDSLKWLTVFLVL
jgi:hypothetical protein